MYPLDAQTILEIQRERQRWTKKRPTKNGWYWWRGGKSFSNNLPVMVEVWEENATIFLGSAARIKSQLIAMNGEWSGPLLPPS